MKIRFYTMPFNKVFNKIVDGVEFTEFDTYLANNFNIDNIDISIDPECTIYRAFKNFNYAYSPYYKKYFFVNIVGFERGMYVFRLTTDFIQTFNETIKNNFVINQEAKIDGGISIVKFSDLHNVWLNVSDNSNIDCLNYTPESTEPILRKSDYDNILLQFSRYKNIYLNY